MLQTFTTLSILAIIALFTLGHITAHQLMLQPTTLATCKILDQSAETVAQSHLQMLKLVKNKLELETDDLTLQSIHLLKQEPQSKKRDREEDEKKESIKEKERLLAYRSQNQLRDWQVSTFVYVCHVCVCVSQCACLCVTLCVRACECVCVCVCISLYIYNYTHLCTYTHTPGIRSKATFCWKSARGGGASAVSSESGKSC